MGLLMGFRIGYSHNRAHLRLPNTNHPSVRINKKVVDERIAAELAAGRLLVQSHHGLHCQPLWVYSPKHTDLTSGA